MAVDIFLKLSNNIKGESQDDTHRNEIDVLAWNWGLTQSGTTHVGSGGGGGKVNVQDITLTKYVDLATNDLIKRCTSGEHIESGEPLPNDTRDKLLATRVFHAGLATMRQLEFALFDFRLHAEYAPAAGARVLDLLAEVRREVAVVQPPDWNRFAHNFGHVFAGGYAAGYYSYKWAEVLAADAFSAFEDCGCFDQTVARRFVDAILASGGSREALDAFVEFRGRAPAIEPLLKQLGLAP